MRITRSLRRCRHLTAFCLFIAGTLIYCVAQTPPADLMKMSLEELMDVKVYSASKHLQSGADAPSSVTVITADEIEKHGYRSLADILHAVRGFFVTYDRNYTSIGFRGFARPGDFNTRILLLVDGHRFNDNVYDLAVVGTEFPLDVDLIARIEIVRGPASSLYGSNALFAVVNIVTERGGDLSGVEVSGEAGSFNTYKGRVAYGQKLRQLEYLISATFYGSRGHNQLFFAPFNGPETNHGLANHADDDQVGSGLATLSFRDFTFQALYGSREKGIPTGAYDTIFNNPGTRTKDSHSYFDLRYQRSFGNSWDLLARTFYDRYTYNGIYMYPSVDPAQASPNLDYADGMWWGAELQLTKTVLRRNRVTVGGEYRNNFRQDQVNYSLNPYLLLMDDHRNSFVASAFAQDELTITKTLALNAGLRYDYYNRVEASIDPRAALIYRPRPSTAIKLIYANAFRVPNVYEMYYSVAPLLPNPDLKPERIRSTELIWEQGIAPHLWISASMFYTAVDGLISDEVVNTDSLIFRNLQDIRSSGLEFEVRGELTQALEASANYSFQETRDRLTDQFLSNSPRHLAKVSLTQALFRKRLFASLDAQYRSGMQSLGSGPVSPFTVVNGTLLSRNFGSRLNFSASVYNVLDKKYFDPPSAENLQLPIQQDGRSFRVKLTWQLGSR